MQNWDSIRYLLYYLGGRPTHVYLVRKSLGMDKSLDIPELISNHFFALPLCLDLEEIEVDG